MRTCQFHPTLTVGEVCGNPASRQVYFPQPRLSGKGYYIYICDECLPGAIEYWRKGGFEVEF